MDIAVISFMLFCFLHDKWKKMSILWLNSYFVNMRATYIYNKIQNNVAEIAIPYDIHMHFYLSACHLRPVRAKKWRFHHMMPQHSNSTKYTVKNC